MVMLVYTITFRQTFFWSKYRFRIIDHTGFETRDEYYRTRQRCLDEVGILQRAAEIIEPTVLFVQVKYDTVECRI